MVTILAKRGKKSENKKKHSSQHMAYSINSKSQKSKGTLNAVAIAMLTETTAVLFLLCMTLLHYTIEFFFSF